MKARFASFLFPLVISYAALPGSFAAGETPSNDPSIVSRKHVEDKAVLSKKAAAIAARLAAASRAKPTAHHWNLWKELVLLSRNHVDHRAGNVSESDTLSGEETSARITRADPVVASMAAAPAVSPQPDAVGGTLNVNGSYAITASDAYQYVNVGVSSAGTVNHSAGTLAVGTTGTNGLGQLDIGTSNAGMYNLSGTGVLNVVGDFYVGDTAAGAFVQTAGTVTVSTGEIDLGSSNGGAFTSTYSIASGSVTTPALGLGDGSASTFTQTGGTVTVGTIPNSPPNGFDNTQAFAFAGSVATYQLSGGTLSIPDVYSGHAPGTGTINFNGGTLQAIAQSKAYPFLSGILAANVQAGGAFIDSNGLTITIAQPLLHSGTGTDGGLTKQGGAGTLILTGAETYNGATVVSAGTLQIDNNSAASPATAGRLTSTSGITINNGGTLLLSGTNSVTDRLNNAASVTINGGGKFSTGGLSEGTSPGAGGTGGAVGLGALTLASTSSSLRASIDFGSSGSALVFSNLAVGSKGTYVTVLDYTGTQRNDTGAATNDRLLFASDPGFSVADLANWQFVNGSGTNYATGGLEIPYNGYFEIVPVPEPATWLGGALLLVLSGISARQRRVRLA